MVSMCMIERTYGPWSGGSMMEYGLMFSSKLTSGHCICQACTDKSLYG